MTDDLTCLISNRVKVRTAAPYVEAWLRASRSIEVVGSGEALDELRGTLSSSRLRLTSVDSLPQVWRTVGRLHRAAMIARVDRSTSRYFEGLIAAEDQGPLPRRLAVALLRRTGPRRLTSQQFNRRMARGIGRWLKNPLPTRFVLAVSRTSYPHLLCGRGARVATLIESWDHPYAHPAGYVSEWIVPWNRDVGRDWITLQDPQADQVTGYPMKLRYALDCGTLPRPDEPTLTYASGSSSRDRHAAGHREERALIAALARGAAAAGWRLLVKPHPVARPGDFDDLDVEVLAYRGEGADDYSLDDRYDARRLGELRRSRCVVNGWTTFGLDAAAAGRPVLQFRVSAEAGWPALADLYRGAHIDKYYVREGDVLQLGTVTEIPGQIEDAIRSGLRQAERHSRRLREWLTPESGPAAAVERVIARLGEWVDAGGRRVA